MGLLNRETLNKAGCHLYSNFSETIQLYFEKPSDYKQRNNFVLRTTVSKCDAPILKYVSSSIRTKLIILNRPYCFHCYFN